MTIPAQPISSQLWCAVQNITVRIVMRFLQAAFYELALSDSRVKAEVQNLPRGAVYSLSCFGSPAQLVMQKQGGVLVKIPHAPPHPLCAIELKSLGIAFRLFTGQLGLMVANGGHGFTVNGDVAATMKFVRLVCVTEAYLFPTFMAKRVLVDLPAKQGSSILLYLKIIGGLLSRKYTGPAL